MSWGTYRGGDYCGSIAGMGIYGFYLALERRVVVVVYVEDGVR